LWPMIAQGLLLLLPFLCYGHRTIFIPGSSKMFLAGTSSTEVGPEMWKMKNYFTCYLKGQAGQGLTKGTRLRGVD